MKTTAKMDAVLNMMRDGWSLCYGSGLGTCIWLQKNGCGRGGDSERVHAATFHGLFKRGLIRESHTNYPTSTWELVE